MCMITLPLSSTSRFLNGAPRLSLSAARVSIFRVSKSARTIGDESTCTGIDSKGRLVYHGVYRPRPPVIDSARPWQPPIPVQVDSSPLVRADFDTRKIDL